MSLFGGLTGGYDQSKSDFKRQSDYWTGKQKQTAGKLYDVMAPGFKSYESIYSGQPTDIERTALSQLQTYGQPPSYMGEAGGALSRALTGEGYQNIIDPTATENLYKSIEERTLKDILPQVMRGAANEANIGGMLHSGTGQKLITDQMGEIVRALSEQLSALKYSDEQQRRDIAREREGRQLTAIPQAGTLSAAELSRIIPGLQYGGAERDIAGTQFDNPLIRLALSYLGLRGQESTTGSGTTSGWDIRGRGGFGIE